MTTDTTTPDNPYDCSHCGEPVDPDEHGDYDTLGDIFTHSQCLADKAWGKREEVATTAGIFKTASITTTKQIGHTEELIESYWQAECPVCLRTHSTDEHSEEARSELLEMVTDCCDIEMVYPADYLHECDICGSSHRETHECKAITWRDHDFDIDQEFVCADCGWCDHGSNLEGVGGSCPDCNSRSIAIAADYSDNDEE